MQRFTPSASLADMCRNIRTLHNFEPPATEDEIQASALQYVRKISGTTKPSRANAEAFERAVDAIADTTRRLLDELVTAAVPRDRVLEAAKARERSARRFAA
jgi:hypothetical protein